MQKCHIWYKCRLSHLYTFVIFSIYFHTWMSHWNKNTYYYCTFWRMKLVVMVLMKGLFMNSFQYRTILLTLFPGTVRLEFALYIHKMVRLRLCFVDSLKGDLNFPVFDKRFHMLLGCKNMHFLYQYIVLGATSCFVGGRCFHLFTYLSNYTK